MPTNRELDRQIQGRIATFVEEVNVLVRAAALEAVNVALGGQVPATGSRRAPKARKGTKATAKKGKRARRTADQVKTLAAKLEKAVKANAGQRLGDLATQLRIDTKDARRPMSMLLDADKVRTEGQRRGMRYFQAHGSRKPASKKKAAPKVAKKARTTKKSAVKKKATKKAASLLKE